MPHPLVEGKVYHLFDQADYQEKLEKIK